MRQASPAMTQINSSTAVPSSAFGRRLPAGLRIYAYGDIHGRFDRLSELSEVIAAELRSDRPDCVIEVFLGDYVDRGPQARAVVEWLIESPPIGDERVCLTGNHEVLLTDALIDLASMDHWMSNGGFATVSSYSDLPRAALERMSLADLQAHFRSDFPIEHAAFLDGLPRLVRVGDYVFAHAGIRPGIPLPEQDAEDLVWIRAPFLTSAADFGAIIVHGHTPVREPELRPNRINVDTGAFMTGRLTAAVLEGDSVRFLQTRPD
jgi:serine/threonine protein phosphatase 1